MIQLCWNRVNWVNLIQNDDVTKQMRCVNCSFYDIMIIILLIYSCTICPNVLFSAFTRGYTCFSPKLSPWAHYWCRDHPSAHRYHWCGLSIYMRYFYACILWVDIVLKGYLMYLMVYNCAYYCPSLSCSLSPSLCQILWSTYRYILSYIWSSGVLYVILIWCYRVHRLVVYCVMRSAIYSACGYPLEMHLYYMY